LFEFLSLVKEPKRWVFCCVSLILIPINIHVLIYVFVLWSHLNPSKPWVPSYVFFWYHLKAFGELKQCAWWWFHNFLNHKTKFIEFKMILSLEINLIHFYFFK
jgi:hypothetical protein